MANLPGQPPTMLVNASTKGKGSGLTEGDHTSLTPAQLAMVDAIAAEAIDLPEDRREAFVRRRCGGDGQVLDEVLALLGHVGRVERQEFLAGDAWKAIEDSADTTGLGEPSGSDTIPVASPGLPGRMPEPEAPAVYGYRLLDRIGSGGWGSVWRAEQLTTGREVALKVVQLNACLSEAIQEQMLLRFRLEVQALGRLQHEGIARIYEAGTTSADSGGQPFFVMELIDGRHLDVYAREEKLSVRQRLELIARVCDAVHYGHQKGLIHRDLKPSNILVEASGQPKVIDFGVARATDSDVAVTMVQTDVGQLVGTLRYMSPEQCKADPDDLDIRSDVYTLGVILYELLCRQAPYDVTRMPVYEATRVVRESTPARPSSINHVLRGDVETITLKAMEKDRERRYASAAELAQDIRRYLNDEPIAARPPSTSYQLRKFARRNRALVTAVACVLVVLVAASVVSIIFAVRAGMAERRASAERDSAQMGSYVANLAAADAALRTFDFATAIRRLNEAPRHLRSWEWCYLKVRATPTAHQLCGHEGLVNCAAYSPDGLRLITGSADDTVLVWSTSPAMPEDGDTGSGSALPIDDIVTDHKINFDYWVRKTEDEIKELTDHGGDVTAAAFSPTGEMFATGSMDASIMLWDASTYDRRAVLIGHGDAVADIAFDHAGRRLFSVSADGTIKAWSIAAALDGRDDAMLWSMDAPTDGHSAIALHPAGTIIACGCEDGTIRLYDPEDGTPQGELIGHRNAVRDVSFDQTGESLASASADCTIREWDLTTGAGTVIGRHGDTAMSVAFHPDGRRIASASHDDLVKYWDRRTNECLATLSLGVDVFYAVFSPDGLQIAIGWAGWTVLRDADLGARGITLLGHEQPVLDLAFGPDGRLLVSASVDGTLRIWDVLFERELLRFDGHVTPVLCAAFSPDGRRVASGSIDGQLVVWDAITGLEVQRLTGPRDLVTAVAWSGRGNLLAAAGSDRSVTVWRMDDFQEIRSIRAHSSGISDIAFTPGEARLITASGDGTIGIWNLDSGDFLGPIRAHDDAILAVACSPDGSMLATACRDATIGLWRLPDGEPLGRVRGHDEQVMDLAFSADSKRLASGSADGTMRIWDVATGEELLIIRDHTTAVRAVAFSQDGVRLASGSFDNSIHVYDAAPSSLREAQRQHVARAEVNNPDKRSP